MLAIEILNAFGVPQNALILDTFEKVVNFIKNEKKQGKLIKVIYGKNIKDTVNKSTKATIRFGCKPENMKYYKDKGEKPKELPWGVWDIFGYTIKHTSKKEIATAEKENRTPVEHTYLRFYKGINEKDLPKTIWDKDGSFTDKATAVDGLPKYLWESKPNPSGIFDVMDTNFICAYVEDDPDYDPDYDPTANYTAEANA